MKRTIQVAAATLAAAFATWGLLEAGFWWLGSRWIMAVAGPGATGAGTLVTARSVGLAGLGYGGAGAVLGALWGVVLALTRERRVRRHETLPTNEPRVLRILVGLSGCAALALFAASDLALATHPETTQNPAWFTRVPLPARLVSYAGLCWFSQRALFWLVERLTRLRWLRWSRHRWLARGTGIAILATALVLALQPQAATSPVQRSLEPRVTPTEASERPDLVVIVVDTVRRDHTSFSGHTRPTTPNLEALARDGAVFERAYSTSSWTLPAHASIFTGLYPSEHGATGEHFWLDDRFATLAERLRTLGYRTWGASGNAMVGPISNLDRGFERYLESWRGGTWKLLSLPRLLARGVGREPDEGAASSVREAIRWIAEDDPDGAPFFLFVNFMEAHAPYQPPEPHRSRMLGDVRAPTVDVYGNRFLDYMLGETDVGEAELDGLRRLYDGEVAYVDQRLGELIAVLRARPRWSKTVVAVVADHGENLGEHRLMDHQLCVYETLTRVPLVLVGPGVPRETRVSSPVQIHDLFATVLAAAGAPASAQRPGAALDLAALARGDGPPRGFAVSEYHRPVAVLKMLARKLELARKPDPHATLSRFDRTLRAIVQDDWKLIAASDGRDELYDLARDPGEQRNLAGTGDPHQAGLAEALRSWSDSLTVAGGEGGEEALRADDAAREQLRALGYIE